MFQMYGIFICVLLANFVNPGRLSTSSETLKSYNSYMVDPEVRENATEIIRQHGFDAQEHYYETKDGYILCLFRVRNLDRIPKHGAKVVLMQHGLLDSAHTWINNLRNQSLAFILADNGFDVWLGNNRGSTYSRRHRNLSPDNLKFWDFSWDDMVEYDLPATINYVLNQTGVNKLSYVGHSQGCQIALARFGQDLELQSRIDVFIALAPAAFLGHVTSPVRIIAQHTQTLESVWDWFGHGEFLPSTALMRFLGEYFCSYHHISSVCSNIIFLFAGFNKESTNMTRLPVYLAHTPAGTSVRNIVHYCQAIISDEFQHFDYGEAGNMAKYGQKIPPVYNLSKITVPMVVYHGGNDWLAVLTDVNKLMRYIKQAVKNRYFLPSYNHLDFVWGVDAAELVYPTVVKHLLEH